MMHEPDWKALADLQFLLYNRVADSLNAAMSAITLSDMPEAQQKLPGFWKDRASAKIENVLNMFLAWSYLTNYKLGEMIPDRAIRPFRVNSLLAWLSVQLQLNPTPVLQTDPLLHANQETLQEALLLLYSAAFTQGTNVRLELDVMENGVWFRVMFTRLTPMPNSFDDLLDSFGEHWRAQDTVFELTTARDFVRLNGSEIEVNVAKQQGSFSFLVRQVGVLREKSRPIQAASETPLLPETSLPIASQKVETNDVNATPVMLQEEIDGIAATPPTLAALRPPPSEVGIPAPIPKEAPTPPIESEVTSPKTIPHEDDDDTRISMKTSLLPPLPPSLHPQKPAESKPVIVPIKIPPPTPPNVLHKSSATAANIAPAKDTPPEIQPISGESAPPATEDPKAAQEETKSSPANETPDSPSREEKP